MDILSYLTELIKAHKAVGIEGLGTFFKDKLPGRYDVETHSFIPPSFKTKFTTELKENTVLKNFISAHRNISLESAEYFIQQFSETVLQSLNDTGKAGFDTLGTLVTNESGEIQLEDGIDNSRFEFYGFPSITTNTPETSSSEEVQDAPSAVGISEENHTEEIENNEDKTSELEEEEEVPEVPSISDEQEVFDEITEEPFVKEEIRSEFYIETPEGLEEETPEETIEEQPEPTVELQKTDEVTEVGTANIWHFDRAKSSATNLVGEQINQNTTNDKRIASWVWIVIAIGVIAAIVIALYFAKPELFSGVKTQEPVKQNKEVIKQPTPPPIDTLKKQDSIIVSTPTPQPATPPTATTDTVTWEIIGASLTKKEVEKYIADMKAKGIVAKAVTMPGKRRIKMSIATFLDEESAKEGRKDLAKKLKNEDLYIYQNKHTHKPL